MTRKRQSPRGWLTTNEDELARRQERATKDPMTITPLDPDEPFFGSFAVVSEGSGMPYQVEIRALDEHRNSCSCPDFQVNGLGTCKHIEAVLAKLRSRPRLFKRALKNGSRRVEIYLDRKGPPSIRITLPARTPPSLQALAHRFFDSGGQFLGDPSDAVQILGRAQRELPRATRNRIRIAAEAREWSENIQRKNSRHTKREAFEKDLATGKRSFEVLRLPLYDYQREGTLHLLFGERALLADDMGLGKTAQAIAACSLLRELKNIKRVLVVSPVSLKAEWLEQISKFTSLPAQIIQGPKPNRQQLYRSDSFFYLSNYEQVLRDVHDINTIMAPDVVILDEAQRIKNWGTKTAQAVKRLQSPYAFVLTGTPLENRIDEIYSITEFLDPHIFGPLFRFNREFYKLNDQGRPAGYKNLGELRRRIQPIMLRRLKTEVEDQLPERIDNNYFVEMDAKQREPYEEYQARVARLLHITKKRPLRKEEHDRLQRNLACMRMLCDTTFILDQESRTCPKLPELEKILEDIGIRNGRKALIFSEWVGMLTLVREMADKMGLHYAWHTGQVAQKKRREEINRFKNDPECKLFLSTDSGGVGLNLQAASVVINLDLPWNPAKLEQRIARAWRKHQKAPVNVINLVTRNSIEHKMLATLAVKKELSDGILDGIGNLDDIKMPSGREAFLKRLKMLTGDPTPQQPAQKTEEHAPPETPPIDRFKQDLLAEFSNRVHLIRSHGDEREPKGTLVVMDRNLDQVSGVIKRLHKQAFAESDTENPIEILDRNTFETIQRLAKLGLLHFPAGGTDDIHRSMALPSNQASEAEKQRKKAKSLITEAERKLGMGHLLDKGGYFKEALSPIHEAVELTIKSMAVLIKAEDDKQAQVPTAVILGLLLPKGLLAQEDAAQIALLRELTASDPLELPSADKLLEASDQLIEKANTALMNFSIS